MSKNQEITQLADDILKDITDSRLPLHNILLKASRLSLLLDISQNVTLFKQWASFAEQNQFVVETFTTNMTAAKDHDVSIASANPEQYVFNPIGNFMERIKLRDDATKTVQYLAYYRSETYQFALGIYSKWKFGNIAESIFERKRSKTEPALRQIFPDIHQRLNSIEQNIASENTEDWKNAVASCRTLLSDLADILNPPKGIDDKKKYINRLKDFISPLIQSETHKNLIKTYLEELKKRIEYTSDLTQGPAHQDRPIRDEAEDIILYTYLLVADLMFFYTSKQK